jgi:CHAT domain-containing protein
MTTPKISQNWAKLFPIVLSLGAIIGGVLSTATLAQTNPAPETPATTENNPELAEAARLNQQAIELYNQRKYTEAEPLYQRALAIRERILGTEHSAVATILNNLGALYRDQGKYAQAEPLFERALAIREQVLGAEDPRVANSLSNLATLYRDRGKYSQAELFFQRALAIREQVLGSEHPDVANILHNLATLYSDRGKYTQAEPIFQRSLAIYEKAFGSEHPTVASTLSNLASLYHEQGKYSQAKLMLQRALGIKEKALGAGHPDVASTLNSLGLLYQDEDNYTEAERLFKRALMIKVLGVPNPDVATTMNNLASLYREQGKYAEAESMLQRALAIKEKALGAEHPYVANNLTSLALLYQDQGKYPQAESLWQRARTIYEQVLGGEHPAVSNSLSNLASLYEAQGESERAIEFMTSSLKIEEQNLAINLAVGSEADRRAYIATLASTTDRAISLHLQADPQNSQAARLALNTILQRKGRVLDALTDSLQTLRRHLTPEDRNLLDELASTRSQLAALIFYKPEYLSTQEYQQQVTSLKAQAEKQETALASRSAQFRTVAQPVNIAAVQQLIPADAALVELILYYPYNAKAVPKERWGNPRYAAYILHSQGEPQWLDLGEANPIDKAVAEFRNAVVDIKQKRRGIKIGRVLDALLMQPIREKLGNSRHILLSPDSQLNLIPFAALVDENNQYLVENYLITYLTTGRDLLRFANHNSSQQPPVILADPDFEQSGNSDSSQIALRGDGELSTDLNNVQFSRLLGTAAEAQELKPLLPTATILTGLQATENALKQVNSPSILHIATHGFFLQNVPLVAPPSRGGIEVVPINHAPSEGKIASPASLENPLLRSGLVLAGFNIRQSGQEDGVLTALEAAGLDLIGTKLLVMSACQTGLGDVESGEGVYGLRRAFAIAGVESQVMSLWYVSDAGTKELMVKYYQKLLQNEGRSEALRQTQLEMLQSEKYQHPYYWAAFIPSGDWTPTQF